MASTTVRINETAHRTLRQLSAQTGESMQTILDWALEEYRRKRFLEDANADFAALRADSVAWQEEQDERAAWDATLADGLQDDEVW